MKGASVMNHLLRHYKYAHSGLSRGIRSESQIIIRKNKLPVKKMADKYAVLVGCNYPNTENELHGCVNDVLGMKRTLLHRFGFAHDNIKLLIDTDESSTKPTGENIRAALFQVTARAKPGDVLFFHYSGHGTLVPIHNHGGETANDECIVPCDFNLLTDEDFRQIVNKVPQGASFTMVSDSCHSGGLIDKEKEQIGPHAPTPTSKEKEKDAMPAKSSKFLPLDSVLRVLREKTGQTEIEAGDINMALFKLFGVKSSSKVKRNMASIDAKVEQTRVHPDMGILLSGCQTNETSEDACPSGNPKEAFGAFTDSLQKVFKEHPRPITNRDLVLRARKLLQQEKFSQHPCLYCSDDNADAYFLCEESNK